MPDNGYAYAVSRVRAKELSLLTAQTVDTLLAAKNAADCVRLLAEKGWGTGDANVSADRLLAEERDKTWSLLAELVEDLSVFDVFLYVNDYHNLKAAIKLCYTSLDAVDVYIPHGTIPPDEICRAVASRGWGDLPAHMREAAEAAMLALTHTGDGQLCDMMIDRAALSAILTAGKESPYQLIRDYAALTVAAANIKIAARCQRTGKSLAFIREALAPCDTLDISSLAQAAASGFEALLAYLEGTRYAEAAAALRVSSSAFERYADNAVMALIKPQRYHPFTLEPIAAYLLARENELRLVRLILTAKQNQLPEASVRERLRELYV